MTCWGPEHIDLQSLSGTWTFAIASDTTGINQQPLIDYGVVL